MVAIATLVLVAILAFFAYTNRVRILNNALANVVEPFHVSLDELDVTTLGEIRITNLSLSPKASGSASPLAEISEARVRYDFAEIRATQRLTSVELTGASIVLDQENLDALTPEQPAEEAFDLETLAYFTDKVSVKDSKIVVDLDRGPLVEADWSFETEALTFDKTGMTNAPLHLELRNVAFGKEKSGGIIEEIIVDGKTNRELKRFDVASLVVSEPVLKITPEWFPRNDDPSIDETEVPLANADDLTGLGAPPNPVELTLESLQLEDAQISLSGFDGKTGNAAFPNSGLIADFSVNGITFSSGRLHNEEATVASFREVYIGEGEAQLLSAEEVTVGIDSIGDLIHEHRLASVEIDDIAVVLSDKTLEGFRSGKKAAPEPNTETVKKRIPWKISKGTINDGVFLMRDWSSGDSPRPVIQTGVEASLTSLQFGGGERFQSDGDQAIRLSNTRFSAPGTTAEVTPLFSSERAEIRGRYSDFDKDSTIEALTIRGPRITITDESLGDWLTPKQPDETTPRPLNRTVYKIKDLDVTGGKIVADSQFAEGMVPQINADFTLQSDEDKSAFPFLYHLSMTDFVVSNHPKEAEVPEEVPRNNEPTLFPEEETPEGSAAVAREEVFTAQKVEADFTAAQLQRTRNIDKVTVTGGVLKVGEGLKQIATPAESSDAEEAPTEPATPDPPEADEDNPTDEVAALPSWRVGEIEITQSRVQFEALIPQVEGLQFALETKLTDVPLSLDGIISQDTKQKIELSGIEIKDPYNSFITVAFLPTIFVEFSLAGLANQEIDQIDLIGPSLHVGQGLFWYIDYQRNFRAQNEGASVALAEGTEGKAKPDWAINTINASNGKIIIAPTGIPVALVPFPFNATTNMKDGDIELRLTIPGEDHVYEFPEYKVKLHGLTGKVQFNVPVEQVDNNLVQTFDLDRVVFRKYEAEDVYLSVTFDSDGIYGAFGGNAYDGYAEGEFNFYLNDPGKWDAWVAGTDLDTGPLTQVIVPDNFVMDGRVSLKVVSEGRNKVLGESTGEISMESPGWFNITKIDEILQKLPEDWKPLQTSLTEIGLNALKRFDYERGSGSLSLENQAGEMQLRFAGPYGTRELNLHLHDNRNTDTGKSDPKQEKPSASARPVTADASP